MADIGPSGQGKTRPSWQDIVKGIDVDRIAGEV